MKKTFFIICILFCISLCGCISPDTSNDTTLPSFQNYAVILPQNADATENYLANYLKDHLDNNGALPPVDLNKYGKNHLEIVITRSPEQKEKLGFEIWLNEGRLSISYHSLRAFEELLKFIDKGKLVDLKDAERLFVPVESSESNGTLLCEKRLGDVRAMYYNVYSGSNNGATPSIRQPFQKELIRQYSPDVAGFQEYSSTYHNVFTPMLKDLGYEELSSPRKDLNCTPIFYKKDTLELLHSGHLLYSDTGDYSKSISWGIFLHKENGKIFGFLNTHFMFRRDGIDANALRVSNSKEALGVFLELQTRYPGIPLILGGDFNCKKGSDPHEILSSGGLVCAFEEAEYKNSTRGHHQFSVYDTEREIFSQYTLPSGNHNSAIDHVYKNSFALIHSYFMPTTPITLCCSDHLPVIIEFS